jgi:hypothetical protein
VNVLARILARVWAKKGVCACVVPEWHEPGQCGAVQCRRHAAMAEQRRRSAGVRVLAARVGYGLPDLVQQDGRGAVVLNEGSNWPEK